MVAVAVKVTLAPLHIEELLAAILIVGATDGNTVMVKAFEVAGLLVTHGPFDVITQVITSLLAIVLVM